MINLIDQIGHHIQLEATATRIISVVPSQTEYLFDLGLSDEVVGITKFCIHPQEWFKSKTRVGGTKTLNFDKIKSLNPDLIIANKEENTQSEIEYLQQHYNVYTSDIQTLNEAYQMMADVAKLTGKVDESEKIIKSIQNNFKQLPQFNQTVLYQIWREPYMVAGQKTFINHLLNAVGLHNVLPNKNSRYEEVSIEEINQLNPDYIFLSSEPYPFKQKHIDELKKVIQSTPILVDGEIFSWYGSRLQYFKKYVETDLKEDLL